MAAQATLFHIEPQAGEVPTGAAAGSAGGVKAGPKSQADTSPLQWDSDKTGVDGLEWFARTYLRVPRGKGAGGPMELRKWQLDMAGTLYHPETNLAVWVLPRGQGKSGIAAAIALYRLFLPDNIGTQVAIIAQDERSAKRLLNSAARMVDMHPELATRARVYRDRIVVPGTSSELTALPAEAHRVEGSDLDLAILDEIGFMPKDTFEAALQSVGKVEGGKVLCIGTPSPAKFRDTSPLWGLVIKARSNPEDMSLQLVEYGAPADLDIQSPETWKLANPAMGDWLTESTIRAQSPPTVRELEFRRARLGQWTESSSEPAFDPESWRKCARPGVKIPLGSKVVLALDGSMNSDSTAIVIGSVSPKPHFEVGGLWEPSEEKEGYEVNHLEVEDRIKELAGMYHVVEVVADPFRWQRTLQVLDEEGLPVSQFPQTARRLTPSTVDLRAAVAQGTMTHADESDFNRHVLRCSIEESSRGIKLTKPSYKEKIDLAACLIMAYSRCVWLGSKRNGRKRKVKGFKR